MGTRRGGTREEQVLASDLSQGDARSRSGRTVHLSGTRLSASLDGRGYSTSKRNNRAMTGAPPGGPTVWRRRRCWTIDEHTRTFRTRSRRRGDPSTTPRRTKPPRKGELNASTYPLRKAQGGRGERSETQGDARGGRAGLPPQESRRKQLSRSDTAVRARGRRTCDSRRLPRSRGRRSP